MSRWTPDEDISSEQIDLATELRVPFIKSEYPRWNYVSAVVVAPETWGSPWSGLTPSEDEVRMIASFIDEYREHWYREGYKQVMRELAPYDIDGGANLGYLRKRPADGGWGYRKRTWEFGPQWVPTREDPPAPLVSVLDRIHTIAGEPMQHWLDWKATHPDLFGAVGAAL